MKYWASLIDSIAWPVVVLVVLILFMNDLRELIDIIKKRIKEGAEIKTPWGSIGPPPSDIKAPKKNESISKNHMALTHSSWRYPKKDGEYRRIMYCFHAIIQAPDPVLEKIEYVKYHLHPSYPNPVRTITDRKSHFKLKELAWGESNLKAEVKVRDQDELIILERYINLTETGPRIP